MGGAYVAKPAPPPPDPPGADGPPGWDEDWVFPGPLPPGYTPAYSLAISAPSGVAVNGAVAVSAWLRDHGTYTTVEPTGSTIVWTATIDGTAVQLRFEGGGSYVPSIASNYSDIGDYWGAEPSIELELTEEQQGETLVLRASSTVDGQSVVKTANITVGIIATLTITHNHPEILGVPWQYTIGGYLNAINPAESIVDFGLVVSNLTGPDYDAITCHPEDDGEVGDPILYSVESICRTGVASEIHCHNLSEGQYVRIRLKALGDLHTNPYYEMTAALSVLGEEYTIVVPRTTSLFSWLKLHADGSIEYY